ncbi:hypothetical protein SBA7_610014 [Candidatus Sulfotelmatobacter sp. SbA7]|nr:hypothetical protein SBA7_610014 [Candidatus Sulfotelmatobacter sp. SbA7]
MLHPCYKVSISIGLVVYKNRWMKRPSPPEYGPELPPQPPDPDSGCGHDGLCSANLKGALRWEN